MNEKVSRKLTIFSLGMTVAILTYHMAIFDSYSIAFSDAFDKWIYLGFTNIFRSFGSLALGYFFMVSAFLLYWNLREDSVRRKVLGRMASLGIPFVVWNAYAIVFYVLKDGVLPARTLKEFLLAISVAPVNGPLWYVFVLILFLAFIPVGLRVRELSCKKQWIALGGVTLLSMGFSLTYYHMNVDWLREAFWLERIVRYIPAYMLGIVLASDRGIRFRTSENKKHLARTVFLLTVLFVVLTGAEDGTTPVNYLIMRIYPVALWYAWECRKEQPIKNVLFRSSFFYFAAHEPIIIILQWVLSKLGLSNRVWSGVQLVGLRIFAVLVITAGLMVVVLVLNRISSKFLNFLLGGRMEIRHNLK